MSRFDKSSGNAPKKAKPKKAKAAPKKAKPKKADVVETTEDVAVEPGDTETGVAHTNDKETGDV
jgi:hypothetical protein